MLILWSDSVYEVSYSSFRQITASETQNKTRSLLPKMPLVNTIFFMSTNTDQGKGKTYCKKIWPKHNTVCFKI